MKDPFGREINYLRISITDRCNLRCRYCMPEDGVPKLAREEILTYEEILRVVEAALAMGFRKFRITGGEPLARRDVVSFIQELSSLKGVEMVALTTNGVLLAPMVSSLKGAGLARINISLDTLSPERFSWITRFQAFSKVIEGLEAAMEAGFERVKINMVPLRGINDDEIVDFAVLTENRPLEVRFIEQFPYGASLSPSETFLPSREVKRRIARVFPLLKIREANQECTSTLYRIQGFRGTIGLISPLSEKFCTSCNRLRLTPDGFLKSCLFSKEEVSIKEVLRKGKDQQVLEDCLARAIRSKQKSHPLKEGMDFLSRRKMVRLGG